MLPDFTTQSYRYGVILEHLLGSRTRSGILCCLGSWNCSHLRQLARGAGTRVSSVAPEVARLERLGLVIVERDSYRLNVLPRKDHPWWDPLMTLVHLEGDALRFAKGEEVISQEDALLAALMHGI